MKKFSRLAMIFAGIAFVSTGFAATVTNGKTALPTDGYFTIYNYTPDTYSIVYNYPNQPQYSVYLYPAPNTNSDSFLVATSSYVTIDSITDVSTNPYKFIGNGNFTGGTSYAIYPSTVKGQPNRLVRLK